MENNIDSVLDCGCIFVEEPSVIRPGTMIKVWKGRGDCKFRYTGTMIEGTDFSHRWDTRYWSAKGARHR